MRLHRPSGSLVSGQDEVTLSPDQAGWDHIGLLVITLRPGESRSIELDGAEAAVVPLAGACRVEAPPFTFELYGRNSVFDSLTDLCYLPVGLAFSIASDNGGDFAIATARAESMSSPRYYPAEQVRVEVRGAGPATRQVNQLLGAGVEGPERLIVVEVLTPQGNWSSYPPHKHDQQTNDEVMLEEIYYYRIKGRNGFGIHRTYTSAGDIDETVVVGDGDIFLVPRGFHGPCVAAPGYDMFYLNVMGGPGRRAWLVSTDPDHAWVWQAWESMSTDPRVPMY